MTCQTAIHKFFFPLLLITAFTAPCISWAQHFEIDTTGFFKENSFSVSHPGSFAAAGPKVDIETEGKVKSVDETVLTTEEVAGVAERKARHKSKTTSATDPMLSQANGSGWDTLNVRVNRTDFSSKHDTSFIDLANIEGGSSAFVFPYKGKILSPFGYRGRHFHAGVDIKLNHGDTVVCAFDGKVRMAKYYAGYGNAVVVRHSNGLETLYGHLSKIKVHVNQELKAGDLIGLGGRTGHATCDHLHFETRYLGEAFNPRQFIDLDNYCLSKDILPITRHTFGRTKDFLPTALNQDSDNDKLPDDVKSSSHSRSKHGKTKGRKFCSIKSGETLYSIAKRNNTTVKDLCSLNGIHQNKTLKIGTRIRVK